MEVRRQRKQLEKVLQRFGFGLFFSVVAVQVMAVLCNALVELCALCRVGVVWCCCVVLCCGVVALWCCGVVVLLCCGVVVLWPCVVGVL
jgi:hypothetical protein